jgi:hypothetical protein
MFLTLYNRCTVFVYDEDSSRILSVWGTPRGRTSGQSSGINTTYSEDDWGLLKAMQDLARVWV